MKNFARLSMITEIERILNTHKGTDLHYLKKPEELELEPFSHFRIEGRKTGLISRYTGVSLFTTNPQIAINVFEKLHKISEKYESFEVSIHSGNYGKCLDFNAFYGISIDNFESIIED